MGMTHVLYSPYDERTSQAPWGALLNVKSGGIPLFEVSIMLVELLFRMGA